MKYYSAFKNSDFMKSAGKLMDLEKKIIVQKFTYEWLLVITWIIYKLQSVDVKMLGKMKWFRDDTWISVREENRIDFIGKLRCVMNGTEGSGGEGERRYGRGREWWVKQLKKWGI